METGSRLKETRVAKGLSLDEISEKLHIRVAYLQALEEDAVERIPSKTQARGFIRSYAKFLELDEKTILLDQSLHNDLHQTEEDEPTSSTNQSETPYHLILNEIGETLHQRRDILGLSRDDIEVHTHIPSHYVDFIETGNFDHFPSPAQARGMLLNYVQFLDLNIDEIMNRYAEALQIRLAERQINQSEADLPGPKPRLRLKAPKLPLWVRMFLSPDLILISAVGIIIIGLTIWGIGRVIRTQEELDPQPTAPSLVEALLPTSTLIPTNTPTPQTTLNGELLDVGSTDQEPTPIPTFQVAAGSPLEIFITVRQRAYLRITTDGQVVFDGRTIPGNNLTFTARQEIRVLTGNAAALQIYFNNQDQGVLGIFGEIAELIYTTDGVVRPTKIPTPTPLATEQITETPELQPTEEVDLPPDQNTPVP